MGVQVMTTARKHWLVCGLTLAVATTVASPASAQRRRGFGRLFGGGARLLSNEAVQKELKLTDKQNYQIDGLIQDQRDEGRELFRDLADLSPTEQIKRLGKFRDASDKAVAKILKPEQNKRFGEIEVQLYGTGVLGRTRFAKALGLNDEQRQKVASVEAESRPAVFAAIQEGRDSGDWEPVRAKMEKIYKDQDEKTLAVLTKDQREAFGKMKGKPFELPERG